MVSAHSGLFRTIGIYDDKTRNWYLPNLYLKELMMEPGFSLIKNRYTSLSREASNWKRTPPQKVIHLITSIQNSHEPVPLIHNQLNSLSILYRLCPSNRKRLPGRFPISPFLCKGGGHEAFSLWPRGIQSSILPFSWEMPFPPPLTSLQVCYHTCLPSCGLFEWFDIGASYMVSLSFMMKISLVMEIRHKGAWVWARY